MFGVLIVLMSERQLQDHSSKNRRAGFGGDQVEPAALHNKMQAISISAVKLGKT